MKAGQLDAAARPSSAALKSAARRRVSPRRAAWARECERILDEYRAVVGTTAYAERHQARWRARYAIDLLVELGLRERRELVEHTDLTDDGWVWAVERVPSPADRTRTAGRPGARSG